MPILTLPAGATQLAARQHGVLARAQLRDLGFSDRQVRRRVEALVLDPFVGGTFLVGGAPRSGPAQYSAATLALPSAVLARRSAAHLLGFPGFGPSIPEVIVPTQCHHRVAGVVAIRRSDLIERHCCVVDGISSTTTTRTVLDLAAISDRTALGGLVDALTRARELSIRVLFDEFDRIARRGRDGTVVMREVLEPRLTGLVVDRSELEKRGLAFLRRHGFPRPVVEFQPPWAGRAVARVDVAFVDERVIVEFDGRLWHDRSAAFERDRLRDQLAAAEGWLVVRITWRQLHEDTAGLAERLHAALVARSVGDR